MSCKHCNLWELYPSYRVEASDLHATQDNISKCEGINIILLNEIYENSDTELIFSLCSVGK